MRILLRDIQSGLFLRAGGKWTPDTDRALSFKLINRAIKRAENMKLRGVELVVASSDHLHLTALPVEIMHPLGHPLTKWHD